MWLAAPPASAGQARPSSSADRFRLFARAEGAITVNSVYCGIHASGEICVDSSGSSTVGGGFWPRNSPQQYMFNSGVQVAGTIATRAGSAGAGDPPGAFFYAPKGPPQQGGGVEPIWDYSDP